MRHFARIKRSLVLSTCASMFTIVLARELNAAEPLALVVMDPLALALSCPCVKGYAQRDYDALAAYLEKRIGRPIKVGYGESLETGVKATGLPRPHIVIGKHSVVRSDATDAQIQVEMIAALTDKTGDTSQRGLFIVRDSDPASTLDDLADYKLILGSDEHAEKHAAALAAYKAATGEGAQRLDAAPSCSEAAARLLDSPPGSKLAAVISSYAEPLLAGCGNVPAGSIRVVGETAEVQFVCAFVTEALSFEMRKTVAEALRSVASDDALCKKLESADGFVTGFDGDSDAWCGWRGPHRRGIAPNLPDRLPVRADHDWVHSLQRSGLGGIAATNAYVVFGDRDATDTQDVWRCLDAETGEELWQLSYATKPFPDRMELDYGNAPRATPLIEQDRVYLCGAFGDVKCVDIRAGIEVWSRNLCADFGVNKDRLSAWGYCASPLIADGRLIVTPGSRDASLVALDPLTGTELWRSPGAAAGYSSLIVATLGGTRQIVGHDRESIGGWDVATGKRLWTIKPESHDEFNVPTPLVYGERLVISSERSGTRTYPFKAPGLPSPRPDAECNDLLPDMATPVIVNNLLFGYGDGLACLDARNALRTAWTGNDDSYGKYVALIGGERTLLAVGDGGELTLIAAEATGFKVTSRLDVLPDNANTKHATIYCHPALVGNHLYLRGEREVVRITLSDERNDSD